MFDSVSSSASVMFCLVAADVALSDLSTDVAKKHGRHVRRGDSAEEMHSTKPSKWTAPLPVGPTIDELSPMAGTVGIELVPQSLVLTSVPQQKDSDGNLSPALTSSSGQHDEVTNSLAVTESPFPEPEQAQQAYAHVFEDEQAVLIAEDADASLEDPPKQKQSKHGAAALDRQRVWYKERPVQLTILGYAEALLCDVQNHAPRVCAGPCT